MAKTIGALRVEGDICLFLGYEFDACGELVARSWEVVFTKLTENIQVSPYFDPTYTRTGWIGQPPVLDRHEVVTIDGDVDTLRQATP